MSIDLPVRDAVEKIEAALIKAMRQQGASHVSCDRGTWYMNLVDGDGFYRETLNLSQMARDMERELS